MDIWNHIPYREQKRLAHIRSLFLKTSGIRKREKKRRRGLIVSNLKLKKEQKALKESILTGIKQGIKAYVGEARKLMAEYKAVYGEMATSALTRNAPKMSEAVKARYIPNRVVLPMVINTLAAVDRRFRKSPLAVYSNGKSIYVSNNFARISKLGTLETDGLIKEHKPQLKTLKWDKAYIVERESFDLVFHKFVMHGVEDMDNIGIYAVPNTKEKKRVGKLMKGLGSSAIERLQRVYDKLITPEEDYGGAHGAI